MFCGHRKVWEATIEVAALAKEEIQKLASNGVNEFWTGGMGEFDHICKHFVLELRKSENLQFKLVLPYITQKANKYKDLYGLNYNEIIIPDLPDVHYKRKITLRNRWMVEQCDCMLAYVWREGGGAGKPCNTRLPAAGFKSSTLRTASAPYSENPRFNAPKPVRSAS